MKSMVVGVAAGKAQGKVILDLNDKEDKVGQADVPTAVVMKDKKVSLLQFDGEMRLEEMETAFQYILKGAEFIYGKQLEALRGRYESIQEQAQHENELIKELGGEVNVEEDDLALATDELELPETSSDEPIQEEEEETEEIPPEGEEDASEEEEDFDIDYTNFVDNSKKSDTE
jgi:hypothetical protein